MRRQLGMVFMLSDVTIARPCALQRIPKIANELAVAHPKAPDLVQELFALAMDLALEERRPQPIETAPDQTGLVLLLFCPRQGGWHTGEWFHGEWTDALTRGKVFRETLSAMITRPRASAEGISLALAAEVVVRAQDEQAGGRVDQLARKGLRDGLSERHLHRLDDLARVLVLLDGA